MNEKIEDVTQSPIEIKLRDGNTYKFGAIGFVDYGNFVQYIKSQKLELVNYIEDKETKLKIIEEIMNKPMSIEELNKEYASLNGIIYLAWKAIQKYHPKIKLEDMNQLVDTQNFDEISVIMANLGGKIENPTPKAKKTP